MDSDIIFLVSSLASHPPDVIIPAVYSSRKRCINSCYIVMSLPTVHFALLFLFFLLLLLFSFSPFLSLLLFPFSCCLAYPLFCFESVISIRENCCFMEVLSKPYCLRHRTSLFLQFGNIWSKAD